ncbi:hypothetical protein BKA67DRAFT_560477 [Truncatella angustata]|uniref:Uncharacterized protein n=1 Tax=Truncatella angustata TaxID=152316 RepID=A0A9P8ZZU6_9PEZI|nr:uncharacterized protein BKA67DRAFT_560477 [Truncatella angustata]KAH6655374.1 hypothetical protein BKA67DRAFT_560477 [Truncatella angustata]
MSEDEGQSATAYRSQRVGADSRPPEITRRITACEACRKQKVTDGGHIKQRIWQ